MKLKRELGEFAISIGTSVAIEEGLVPLDRYPQQLWINLRTLFRNLYTSIESDVRFMPKLGFEDLTEEMQILATAVSSVTDEHTNVVYYLPDYKSIQKLFPKALHKVPKTIKQLQYAEAERDTYKLLMQQKPEHAALKVMDTAIKGDDRDTLMITHFPVDLLSKRYFSRLGLLETHTGKIKRENAWSTKLTGGSNLLAMPFNAMTLQVFGDGATQFNSMPHVYKKTLNELAQTKRWNSMTTKEKISSDVKGIRDPLLRKFLLALLACTVK